MAGNSRDSGRAVTARALSVLTAFDAEAPRLTLTAIASRAGIPLATAHRLVGELERWGALQRDAAGRYSIGLRLWEIGRLAPVHTDLRRAAMPYLRDLHETTGECVHLAVRDGFEVVHVENLTGHHCASAVCDDGRQPLHTTGPGKILLAHAPESVLHGYREAPPNRHVHRTGVHDRLDRELHLITERGYAREGEETVPGSRSVTVGVRDTTGGVVAALGIAAHSARSEPPMLLEPLLPAAEAIGRRLDALDVRAGTVH